MKRTVIVALIALTTSCAAGSTESIPDPTATNTEPATLVVFPEYVGNVYTKCDNGNRIYVHLNTGSVDVVDGGCRDAR